MAYANSDSKWKLFFIYLVVGGLVYAAIYYFYFAKKGGYSYTPSSTTSSPVAVTSSVSYLKDIRNMSLYTFGEDSVGVSNCYDSCATYWPPYLSKTFDATAGYSLVTRKNGDTQLAYKGMPLYYYFKDKKTGDIFGDGVDGTWHLAVQ